MTLKISSERLKNGVLLRIAGRLDAPSTPLLEKQVQTLLDTGQVYFLLDFAEVEYLSSAGMRLLLSVTKKLKPKGGCLCLFSLGEEVREIIKMAGFEKILAIAETEEKALERLP